MDWKRAKSIMIVLFLIINVFLSYQLFSINRSQYKYIDKQELDNVIEHLSQKHIQVQAAIPDRVLIAPSIKVSLHRFEPQDIEKTIFGKENYTINTTLEGFTMKNASITMDVKNGIAADYINHSINIPKNDADVNKCIKNAYDFADKLKLNMSNKYIRLKDVQQGYVRLVLGQKLNNIPVEGSEIDMIVTEQGVAEARISWFDTIKADKRNSITTPVVALLKAYENRGDNDGPLVIKEIREGYYFTADTQNSGSGEIQTEGIVSPMWVIKSDKNEIYINAYNEKIEKIK